VTIVETTGMTDLGRTTGRARRAERWLRAIDPNPTIATGTVGEAIARIVARRLR
jgi:hypothetical protein